MNGVIKLGSIGPRAKVKNKINGRVIFFEPGEQFFPVYFLCKLF
jgi:hypothetical protein